MTYEDFLKNKIAIAKRLIRRAKTIRHQGERVIACILEEKHTKIA